jgi:hypothetical protein
MGRLASWSLVVVVVTTVIPFGQFSGLVAGLGAFVGGDGARSAVSPQQIRKQVSLANATNALTWQSLSQPTQLEAANAQMDSFASSRSVVRPPPVESAHVVGLGLTTLSQLRRNSSRTLTDKCGRCRTITAGQDPYISQHSNAIGRLRTGRTDFPS